MNKNNQTSRAQNEMEEGITTIIGYHHSQGIKIQHGKRGKRFILGKESPPPSNSYGIAHNFPSSFESPCEGKSGDVRLRINQSFIILLIESKATGDIKPIKLELSTLQRQINQMQTTTQQAVCITHGIPLKKLP